MAKQGTQGTGAQPFRLAPAGPGVQVVWNPHSSGAFQDHVATRGLTLQQTDDLIRSPNLPMKCDEHDPKRPPRVRRWIAVAGIKVRVVLETRRPATKDDPGSVDVVTLFDETRPL